MNFEEVGQNGKVERTERERGGGEIEREGEIYRESERGGDREREQTDRLVTW